MRLKGAKRQAPRTGVLVLVFVVIQNTQAVDGRETLMAEKEVMLTREGLAKLERELEELKTVKRREVANRIRQALEFGDISENSEYDDAKNEQAFIEGKIMNLEKMLRNAKLIDETAIDTETVGLGVKVRLKEVDAGDAFEFILVGSAEADPAANKVSNVSPVGRAILGQKAGAIVEVDVPAGRLRYEIISIGRA